MLHRPDEPTRVIGHCRKRSFNFLSPQPGHRIRVEISSSNFPRFARNLNTGNRFGISDEIAVATQTIYHDTEHPSQITLPVISR
jgi:predicted acyl esterase